MRRRGLADLAHRVGRRAGQDTRAADATDGGIVPDDENADDVASTASEWVFITDKDQIASIIDLDFGAGIEILNFN